jgi:hypothetical protein
MPPVPKGKKTRAAFHEAGRFIAAKHFEVAQVTQIWSIGYPILRYAGRTTYTKTSPFNESVIGWSGGLGEMMQDKTLPQWEKECETVLEMFNANELTKADTDLINRHGDKRKTFKAAIKILAQNFKQVAEVAQILVEQDSFFAFP